MRCFFCWAATENTVMWTCIWHGQRHRITAESTCPPSATKNCDHFMQNYPKNYSLFYAGHPRDPRNKSMWKWSTGEAATFDSWEIGEQTSSEQCDSVKNNQFHIIICIWQIPFFVWRSLSWSWCSRKAFGKRPCNTADKLTLIWPYWAQCDYGPDRGCVDLSFTQRFIAGHWFWVNETDLQYKVWSLGGELQCPALNQRWGVYNVKRRAWKSTACERRLNFLCVIL